MASQSLGTLFVDLMMRTAGFETDAGRAARVAEQSMKSIKASTVAMGVAMGEALVGAAEKIASFVEHVVASDVTLAHLAEKTGLTAEALGGLRLAATQSGVDMDALGKTITKVAGIQFEAAAGNKAAAAEMKFFGITAKDTADNAVDKLIRAFNAMPASFDRAGLAVKIFGNRLGTDFLLVADKAKDGLGGLEEAASKLGVSLDEKTLAAAEDFEKSMALVKLQLQAIGEKILVGVIPILNDFVKELSDPEIAQGFKDIAQGALTAFTTVISWASQAAGEVRKLAADIAAASAGAAQGDIVREQDQADRLKARIAQLTHGGGGNRIGAWMQGPDPLYQATGQANLGNYDPNKELAFLHQKMLETQAQLTKDNAAIAANAARAAGVDPSKYGVSGAAGNAAATNADAAANEAAAKAAAHSKAEYDALLKALNAGSEGHARHAKAAKDDSDAVQKAADAFDLKLKELQDMLDGPAGKAQKQYDKELASFNDLAAKGKVSVEQLTKAHELLNQQLKIANDAIKAGDLGPVTEEANRYIVALDALRKNEEALQYSATEAAQAEALLAKGHELSAKAAQDELDPGAAILRDLTDQLNLTQMNSAAQATFNQLKNLSVEDQKKWHNAILGANQALEQQNKLISLQDSLRGDMSNFFTDLMTGSKSAAQAFKDFANSVAADISRMIAQNFTEKLLGQTGQNGGGAGGGFFSSILSALFGGGGSGGTVTVGDWMDVPGSAMGNAFADGNVIPFARGGIVNSPTLFPMANGMGLMGEAGPEAVMPLKRVNGKLGVVMSGGGGQVIQNFYINGSVTQKTAAQMRQEEAIKQRRAVGRNS